MSPFYSILEDKQIEIADLDFISLSAALDILPGLQLLNLEKEG